MFTTLISEGEGWAGMGCCEEGGEEEFKFKYSSNVSSTNFLIIFLSRRGMLKNLKFICLVSKVRTGLHDLLPLGGFFPVLLIG